MSVSDYAGVGHLIDGICEDVDAVMQRNELLPPKKPATRTVIPFPIREDATLAEEMSAERWYAAVRRLSVASARLDAYLCCASRLNFHIELNCPTVREFQEASRQMEKL